MVLSGTLFAAAVGVTFIGGAVAWLIVRRPARGSARIPGPGPRRDPDGPADRGEAESQVWTAADDAVARHPAGRGRVADPRAVPKGPDDDQEFLRALGQAIRRNPPVG